MTVLLGAVLPACSFPTPSKAYACDTDADCDSDRVCSADKFCVIASAEVDAAIETDAPLSDAMPIDGDPFAATRTACMAAGYTLAATTGGLYRHVTTNVQYAAAKTDCDNDVPGATHLIVVSTTTEKAFQTSTALDSWFGFTDQGTEGTWRNPTNETLVITLAQLWASDRPDGGTRENCALIRTGGADDVECNQTHDYVCECDGHPVVP